MDEINNMNSCGSTLTEDIFHYNTFFFYEAVLFCHFIPLKYMFEVVVFNASKGVMLQDAYT